MSGREEHTFPSGDGTCAAWLYRPDGAPPQGVPCVVMGQGFSLTRHDGLDAFARRFAEAGVAAMPFDYRHFGDSSGTPRQRFRRASQAEDLRAAIRHARGLDGIDGSRIVLWGFSFGCVHVVRQAAAEPAGIAGVIALAPFLDGLRRALGTPPRLSAWITPRAIADVAGRHTTIPVTAPPGDHGAMTLPGEYDGFRRVVPEGSPWRNEVSPGIFLTVATLRPYRLGPRLPMPVWVGLGERDVSVARWAVERFAATAPHGELLRYPYDHFDYFVGDGAEIVAGDQAAFLRRHGLTAR